MLIVHDIIDNEFYIEIKLNSEESELVEDGFIIEEQTLILGHKFNLAITKRLPGVDDDAFDEE